MKSSRKGTGKIFIQNGVICGDGASRVLCPNFMLYKGQTVNQVGCHQCQAQGHLLKDTGYTDANCCLFDRFLGKSKHEARKTSCMEKRLEMVQLCLWVQRGRVSGNHQGRIKSVSQVIETQIWCPYLFALQQGGLIEGNTGL